MYAHRQIYRFVYIIIFFKMLSQFKIYSNFKIFRFKMSSIKLNLIVLFCSLCMVMSLKINFNEVKLLNLTESEINKYWQDYKIKFNRSYSNITEEEFR
jgi:hypothetical protein